MAQDLRFRVLGFGPGFGALSFGFCFRAYIFLILLNILGLGFCDLAWGFRFWPRLRGRGFWDLS